MKEMSATDVYSSLVLLFLFLMRFSFWKSRIVFNYANAILFFYPNEIYSIFVCFFSSLLQPLKWELKQKPGMSPPHGGFNPDDPNQQIVAEDIFDEYGGESFVPYIKVAASVFWYLLRM